MKNRIVDIPSIKDPIKASPGFFKKELADHKLDIMGLCGAGCAYCSSNEGNYLRIRRADFAAAAETQLGERLLPGSSPELSFRWTDFEQRLDEQLVVKDRLGLHKTLVFSQLTDAFSPWAVKSGLTRRTLDKVLARTLFRIRVLTKFDYVGRPEWINLFKAHPGRFIVGLSIGTLDDAWARRVEVWTSAPTARVKALHRLQDAGVPTYGMLCPVFPHVVQRYEVGRLVDAIRPERCETVWAEPYNDRNNWVAVAAGCDPDEYRWFRSVFGGGDKARWSEYAGMLYANLTEALALAGQMHKLRYLLYEGDVMADEAQCMEELNGILLQGPKGPDGYSKHEVFREAEKRKGVAPAITKSRMLPVVQ